MKILRIIKKITKVTLLFLDGFLIRIFHKTKFSSSIYYFLFNRSFHRELQAVLSGRVHHLKIDNSYSNYYTLVRNIHRLEKGILMRPRRSVFAKNYIGNTVSLYNEIIGQSPKHNSQLNWFDDVLMEYFSIVGDDEFINKQKNRFLEFRKKLSLPLSSNGRKKPYRRTIEKTGTISFDQFLNLTRKRRSVRWFLDKKVPREKIDKAITAAAQSPSACNRQPFEIKIFDTAEKVKQIVNIPMGTVGYAHNIPTVAVVVGNLDAYFNERDRHVIYIDASLASMTFMLALETMGLSSCPINWPDIENKEKQMEKILNLKSYQRPIMLIAIGYPDEEGMIAYSEKKPLEMIRSFNK